MSAIQGITMSEVLVEFDTVLAAENGVRYKPRVCGRPAGHMWQGWIEFEPLDDGAPVQTGVESEQPNLVDLQYWAGGLTQVFLEGALARAIRRQTTNGVARPQTRDTVNDADNEADGRDAR
jgi:hypothetical protein